MTAATDPRRRRHAVTPDDVATLRVVVNAALARHEALFQRRRFWAEWVEHQSDRLDQFGDIVWLSDRELEILEEIRAWLETVLQ